MYRSAGLIDDRAIEFTNFTSLARIRNPRLGDDFDSLELGGLAWRGDWRSDIRRDPGLCQGNASLTMRAAWVVHLLRPSMSRGLVSAVRGRFESTEVLVVFHSAGSTAHWSRGVKNVGL